MTGDPGTHAAAFGAHRHPHLHLHRPRVERCSKRAALALLCVAQFMMILDVSSVNVALPSIRRDLHVSDTDLHWEVNAYALAFGGFLLLGGRAADLLGRRRVFIFGPAPFSGASLVGGLSGSIGTLTAARALQGLGAAVVSHATLGIRTTMFIEPDERRRAMGNRTNHLLAGHPPSPAVVHSALTSGLACGFAVGAGLAVAAALAALLALLGRPGQPLSAQPQPVELAV
jgi:MFS family permease